MGQLKFILKLSLLTNFICISVILMSVVLLPVNVIAYPTAEVDCYFDTDVDKTEIPWVITAKPISEKTPPDEVIWDVTTRNIKSSVSIAHPHSKYLTGLRYTSRYVYQISKTFVNFVNTENSIEIGRLANFTCSDNESIVVRFRFPLIDENDAPRFATVPSKELRVNLATIKDEDIINSQDPIVAEDKDFDPGFNNLIVTSDRPDILLIETDQEDLPMGIGKKFDVKLRINLSAIIPPGRYIFNLFATDGQFTAAAPLHVVFF